MAPTRQTRYCTCIDSVSLSSLEDVSSYISSGRESKSVCEAHTEARTESVVLEVTALRHSGRRLYILYPIMAGHNPSLPTLCMTLPFVLRIFLKGLCMHKPLPPIVVVVRDSITQHISQVQRPPTSYGPKGDIANPWDARWTGSRPPHLSNVSINLSTGTVASQAAAPPPRRGRGRGDEGTNTRTAEDRIS